MALLSDFFFTTIDVYLPVKIRENNYTGGSVRTNRTYCWFIIVPLSGDTVLVAETGRHHL